MSNLRITYSDGTTAEAELDNSSTITTTSPSRGADGGVRAGDFTQVFRLESASKVEVVGNKLAPRLHPSGQNASRS